MMSLLSPWLKSINLYATVALIALGGAIVSGLYIKGYRDAQRKWALEMADKNKEIAKQAGKDEAEVSANDKAGEVADAVVAGAVAQTCVLTDQTAKLLASVK